MCGESARATDLVAGDGDAHTTKSAPRAQEISFVQTMLSANFTPGSKSRFSRSAARRSLSSFR